MYEIACHRISSISGEYKKLEFSLNKNMHMYSWSKEKRKPYSNTNYCREMKLVPINMNCLLQFGALKFFLVVTYLYLVLRGGLNLTLIFFNLNPQQHPRQRNRKVYRSNFHNFFGIILRVIRCRNCN